MISNKKTIVLAVFFLILSSPVFAGPLRFVENTFVAAVMKVMARAYLSATSLEKIKKDGIKKITFMDDDTFRKEYALVQPYFSACKECGEFNPSLDKPGAIAMIKVLTKRKISLLIGVTPNRIVGYAFRKYILHNKESLP